jgi:peptide/nickel transport system substrate-binding protein
VRAGLPATGPYRYVRFDRKREVLLVRNPRFREWSVAAQPAGYPDRIHVRLGLSFAAQVAAIRDGRADLPGDNFIFDDALLRRLSVAYASRLRARPINSHDWAFLDTRSRPFDDERARRAVNLAVDRSVFAGAINARPTCQVLPTNSIGYRSYCPSGIRGDLPRARRLVAQSGTRGARVRVWSPGDLGFADAHMRIVVTALKRLGYRTSVRRFENYGAYFTALAAGGRPEVGYFPWIADYQAPSAIVGPQLSCGGEVNPGRFCDPRIDALAARAAARQIDDPRAAYDLWAEVDRRLTDAAAVVPLTDGIEVAFVSERLRNVNQGGLSQLWVR